MKLVKTRLRTRLSQECLNWLLTIRLNGGIEDGRLVPFPWTEFQAFWKRISQCADEKTGELVEYKMDEDACAWQYRGFLKLGEKTEIYTYNEAYAQFKQLCIVKHKKTVKSNK